MSLSDDLENTDRRELRRSKVELERSKRNRQRDEGILDRVDRSLATITYLGEKNGYLEKLRFISGGKSA